MAGADDYDPQGDPPEEYPEDVANAIDGDRATVWTTSDLRAELRARRTQGRRRRCCSTSARTERVGEVGVDFGGTPTEFSLYLSDQPPSGVPTGEPVAEDTADQNSVTVSMPDDSSGRYLLVWLTSLPEQGGFTGEIREITVRS